MTRAITRNGALRRRARQALFHFNKRGTVSGPFGEETREERWEVEFRAYFCSIERCVCSRRNTLVSTRAMEKARRVSLRAARLISARHDSSGLDARGCTWREKVGDKKERRCVAGNCRAQDEDEEMVENGAGEGKGYYKSALARLLESSECV